MEHPRVLVFFIVIVLNGLIPFLGQMHVARGGGFNFLGDFFGVLELVLGYFGLVERSCVNVFVEGSVDIE